MIPEQPLLLALLAFMAVLAGIGVYRLFRRLGRRGVNGALGLGVLAVACTVIAQKPSPPLFFCDDIYIYDGGSYATNDTVHVELARRVMELPIDDCDVIAFMRERALTNAEDFVMLPTYKFGDYPMDFTVSNATNYNYWFYLDYVPPSPVHTNGVWQMRGFSVPEQPDTYAFPNTRQETIR